MENIFNNTSSQTPIVAPRRPTRSGKLVDASERFTKGYNKTKDIDDLKVEENTFEAKEFPVKLEIPVYIIKGEKATIRITREPIGSATFKPDIVKGNQQDPLISDYEETKKIVDHLECKIEELHATIKEKDEEAGKQMDKFQTKLRYFKYYSFIWGLSAVLASVFASLGMLGVLPPFPSISGVLASATGLAGAYMDWKDREKQYD